MLSLSGNPAHWIICSRLRHVAWIQTSCKPCDKGTYGRDGSNLEPRDRCLSCPKGKWGDIEGLVNVSFCQDCSPGKYAASAGLQGDTFCTPCRIGRYLNLSGAFQDGINTETCNLCEPGKLSQFGKVSGKKKRGRMEQAEKTKWQGGDGGEGVLFG